MTRRRRSQIVSDYIAREGELDGVWMDAGATSVAAIEAFEDAGQEIPPITGEDQLDFLRKWQEDDLTAIAPVYSNFQWRTPIIAATRILNGEEVPKEWILPQPPVTEDNLDDILADRRRPAAPALRTVRLRGDGGLPREVGRLNARAVRRLQSAGRDASRPAGAPA